MDTETNQNICLHALQNLLKRLKKTSFAGLKSGILLSIQNISCNLFDLWLKEA